MQQENQGGDRREASGTFGRGEGDKHKGFQVPDSPHCVDPLVIRLTGMKQVVQVENKEMEMKLG